MDQTTFDRLSAQGKINIANQLISETQYRLMTPVQQNPETFDCHYVIPANPTTQMLEVMSNSKNPVKIKQAEMLFSLTSLNKAFHVLYENRDLMGIAIPCNIKIELETGQPFPMFDVNFYLSLQDLEMKVGEQVTKLDNTPVGMLTFQNQEGEQYFINVQISALYASLTQVQGA